MTPEIRAILAADVRTVIYADALLANLRAIRNRYHERAVAEASARRSPFEKGPRYSDATPFAAISSEGPGLDAMLSEADTYLGLIRGTLTDRLRAYRIEVPRERTGWHDLERLLSRPEGL